MAARLSDRRRLMVEALEKNGGSLVATGRDILTREDIAKEFGFGDIDSKTFANFMNSAQKSGVIRVKKNGRKWKAVYLVHGKRTTRPATKRVPKRGSTAAKQRRAGRPKGRTNATDMHPVPTLGAQLNVFMLSEQDGRIQIGLRSDEGSWMMEVTGFAAAS